MGRWSFGVLLVTLVVPPSFVAAQDAVPQLELGELEIVGAQERWPSMFEPDTRIEPGLAPRDMADRYAYRAAEYDWAADHYRGRHAGELKIRSWPDRVTFGDGHFTRLYDGWADELDAAAARSRILSVQYNLIAFDVIRTAALGLQLHAR